MRTVLRFLAVSAIAAVLVVVSAALMASQARTLAGAAHVEAVPIDLDPLSQRSVVLARDGSLLAVLHAEENRLPIPLDEVPQHVIDIVLAVEDEDFYHHDGVNLRATMRALLANVQAGDIRQGGSTITQQLVKNALLTPEQDLDRKVREAVLAVRLEQQLDKDEILERYLNTVYLGNGTYGLQAAAELYWGIDAADLNVEQAALLAGMIRNPIGYDPFLHPRASLERRNWVIDRLARIGQIEPEQADLYKAVPLPDEPHRTLPRPQDHFVEEIKRILMADPRLGDTATERYNALFRGGLTITTTLDPRLQLLGIAAVQDVLPDTGGQFTAALVAVEPGSGAVRALYGGPEFASQQYNLATQGLRQPGSSFKPFVLAAHLEEGGSANDTVSGAGPCTFRARDHDLLIEDWRVQNFGNSRGRSGTIASSMHASLNCAFARLALLVGPEKVVEVARRLGITSPLIGVPAIALGAEEVHPIEMAAAFAAFANDGVYHAPYFVEEVRNRDGKVLFSGRSEPVQAVSTQTARVMNQVLRGVVERGTGTRARLQGHQAAGKTGTTQNHEDAWFVGYTPHLSTAALSVAPARAPGCRATRRRARPERPRTTRTRGSWGTRRTSRRRCGWALPTRRSPCATWAASGSPAGRTRR